MSYEFCDSIRSWGVIKLIMNDPEEWDVNSGSLVLKVHHLKKIIIGN